MNPNSTAAASGYSSMLAIVLFWLVGAAQSGDWHMTMELAVSVVALITPVVHAVFIRTIGYDPYAGAGTEPQTPAAPRPAAMPSAAAIMFLVFALGAGVLASCQSQQPAQTIGTVESSLTALERTAIGYVTLPRCPTQAPVCSDAAIIAQIKDADQAAYDAIKKAQAAVKSGGSPDATAMTAALSAFQSVLASPQVVAALKGK